jgi:hypothetical protein
MIIYIYTHNMVNTYCIPHDNTKFIHASYQTKIDLRAKNKTKFKWKFLKGPNTKIRLE